MPDLYAPLHQQGIAMPADALRASADFDRLIYTLFEQQMVRDCAQPVSESPICFLKCDDIRVNFAEHFQYPFGTAPTVGADAFADIVGRDLYQRHGQLVGPK